MSFAAKLMPDEAAGGGRIAPNADGGGDAELSVSEGGGAIAAPATKKIDLVSTRNPKDLPIGCKRNLRGLCHENGWALLAFIYGSWPE
jgi:hypothetical protein